MSASNAAAKKRRAMIPVNSAESMPNIGGRPYTSTQPQATGGQRENQPPTGQTGFTLQQVISVIDNRLVSLEKNVDEIKKHPGLASVGGGTATTTQAILPSEQEEFNKQANENFQLINDNLTEYDNRFEILANEIADIKTILLKLQSYTMSVNKMLLEERQQSRELSGETTQLGDGSLSLNDIYSFSTQEEVTYSLLPAAADDETEVGGLANTPRTD
jgi:hypothetical protein